jgi:hypothetical protein
VNPGLSSFTWLSQRALGWEKYKFLRLEFVYIPSTAVTSTPGSVYLGLDYDPTDAAPGSLGAMSSYESFEPQRVFLSKSILAKRNRMFDGVQYKRIRCGPVAGDLELFDGCSLIIATDNCSSAAAIGDVWVNYEIELVSPQTEPAVPKTSRLAMFNLSANMSLTSAVEKTLAYDEEIVNAFGVVNTSGVFTLPCGTFRISSIVSCRDTSAEDFLLKMYGYIDGIAAAIPFNSFTENAGGYLRTSLTAYVVSDGTTTYENSLIAIGAAGTLTAVADQCKIVIEVV